jgi:ribosomal-protein-alanine N-acetyltransferase
VLIVRHAKASDIIPVIALAFETLPERYNPVIFNQFYETSPDDFLVALHNNSIVGFLIGIKTTSTIARILMLSVKERNRKQGIGTALLKVFLTEMKEHQIKRLDLEVRTTNHAALEFYKKQGFILRGILPQFYQNGEDAYSMTKEL